MAQNKMIQGFSNLLNPNFLSGSDEPVDNTVYDAQFAGEVRDTGDSITVDGDVLGVSGNFKPISITARASYFEPIYLERLLALHSAWRRTVNPLRVTFNSNGQLPSYDNLLEFTIENSVSDPETLLGYAIRCVMNDTLIGEGSFEVSCDSGLVAEYVISDANDEGVLVVLNHARDFSSTVSLTTTWVTGDPTLTFEAADATATVASQYYVQFTNDMPITVNGSNVTLYVYPLYLTRTLSALVEAAINADRIGELASLIANGYELGS